MPTSVREDKNPRPGAKQRHQNFVAHLQRARQAGHENVVEDLMNRRARYQRRMMAKGEKVSTPIQPGSDIKRQHRGGGRVSSGHGTQPGSTLKRVMHEGRKQEAVKRRMERKEARKDINDFRKKRAAQKVAKQKQRRHRAGTTGRPMHSGTPDAGV